jgi:prevent-host-death family protein
MNIVSLQEAQATLPELIDQLAPGDELVITQDNRPVAKVIPFQGEPADRPRQPGTMRGTVLYMAPDFDAPLEDFREYME